MQCVCGLFSNPDWYLVLAIIVAGDGSALVRMLFFALFRLLQSLELQNETRRYEVFILVIVDWCCWKSLACITGAAGEHMWDSLFVFEQVAGKRTVIWLTKTNDMEYFKRLLHIGVSCYHEVDSSFSGEILVWTCSALCPFLLISFSVDGFPRKEKWRGALPRGSAGRLGREALEPLQRILSGASVP